MHLVSHRLQGPCASFSSPKPCLYSPRPWVRRRPSITSVSAAEKQVDVDPKVPLISSKETGPLPYPIDEESFEDLMGFKGAAPERVNGRIAMWAFLICSIQEVFSGQTVTQQALAHPVSATFLGIILSIASLAPKYISGVALGELHEAASRDGLPPSLRFFNKTHELWLGRVAMIGLVGLGSLELFLGHALFHRG